MTTIFDDVIAVDDGMLLLEAGGGSDEDDGDPQTRFAGQAQGLLGVQFLGQATLMVGLQSGSTRLKVETLDAAPALEPDYEDVVEGSLTAEGSEGPAMLMTLYADDPLVELPLQPGETYRLRWSCQNMDAGAEAGLVDEGEEPVDTYLLQVWIAASGPDQVLREGSEQAAYWRRAWVDGTEG